LGSGKLLRAAVKKYGRASRLCNAVGRGVSPELASRLSVVFFLQMGC